MTEPQAPGKYHEDEQRWSALMVAAQSGDEQQYQQLLTEISSVIHRYLVSRYGAADFVEDCVQDCLLAVHSARHTYQSTRPFRPWLFAIVRHKAIDWVRKNRMQLKAVPADDHAFAEEIAAANEASRTLDAVITQGQLINALASPFKQAVVLTKLVGLSTAEAAKVLDITEGALKVRVHRGIANLKRLWEADER